MYFVIGLLASTALYAIIFSLICVFGIGIDMTNLLLLSILSYILLRIIHLLWYKICRRFDGFSSYENSYLSNFWGYIGADITNPFRGILALKGASKVIDETIGFWFLYSWGQVIVHFVWAITFWGFLIFGFVNVLM